MNNVDSKLRINPKLLRTVAGGFATGITVICTEKGHGEIIGLTANSFVSISLDPPLVLFSIKNEAAFLAECAIGKPIGISILSEEQKEISNQFARIAEVNRRIDFISNGRYHCIKGALAWYHSTITSIIPAGDHQLILCEVDDLGRDESAKPLLYYSGYKSIGESI